MIYNQEPLPKRRKLSVSGEIRMPLHSIPNLSLDIEKYIPAGCIRIRRSECHMPDDLWDSCSKWRSLWPGRDLPPDDDSYLPNPIRNLLIKSSLIHYSLLHSELLVRLEFKTNDEQRGQVRVHILPDDVGRSVISRNKTALRKAMQRLLLDIDVTNTVWNAEWIEETPFAHIDPSLDQEEQDDASLFYIFNTLPSPKPEPELITDEYARNAIYSLLESDVEGLTTTMHEYQRRSAATMLQRETQPSRVLDPRLRPVLDQQGSTWFCDFNTGAILKEARTYETTRGGICAETMGLGKTLICLAVILATKDISSQIPIEYSVGTVPVRPTTGSLREVCAAMIGRAAIPWKNYFTVLEAEGLDYSECRKAIQRYPGHYFIPPPGPRRGSRNPITKPPRKIWLSSATIVVVPANLVKQWQHEIQKHTFGLKVLVLISSKDKLPVSEELREYDIILFSKQRFDLEATDGFDKMGRSKSSTFGVCECPYIGATRDRDCTCFKQKDTYQSPLKEILFKRLISDEGHTFGNASKASRTDASTVIDFLQVSARWIISGTPTRGLYGAEVSLGSSRSTSHTPLSPSEMEDEINLATGVASSFESLGHSVSLPKNTEDGLASYREERKDLEKLGNIASVFLKARPWANTLEDGDIASWSQYVLQPRHGSKSHGNMGCLRSTLEGMIIRHRPEDVERDIILPPLQQSIVNIEGSVQDKLSLNIFSMMIVSNAVTSERKDADYLFHPRQRKALNLLVSNLRQASFHWSGFTMEDVRTTVDLSRSFLEKREVNVTTGDEGLLEEAIRYGELVMSNSLQKCIHDSHELPVYIQNDCPDEIRSAWALDGKSKNPTLMGLTMVHAAQKFVTSQLWKEDPMDGLVGAGKRALQEAHDAAYTQSSSNRSKKSTKASKSTKTEVSVELAGGLTVVAEESPRKRSRNFSKQNVLNWDIQADGVSAITPPSANKVFIDEESQSRSKSRSALRKTDKTELAGTLNPLSPLATASIISTSSAKLSYLMDRIMLYQEEEKIIVFYEAENVAYYIAQALECLQIKHLIYAKSLPSARKAQYVVTFNQTDTFRVLLMDISQAAFGLDLSSASRVYFVNPVFSPQVEAQAVKRAHRIGQTKPVFVETLVLKGSIEEVILDRRSNLTTEEHNKCKNNILDDDTMYNWIRNVRFMQISMPEIAGPEQMAELGMPQLVFGRNTTSKPVSSFHDPDADLVVDGFSPKAKRKINISFGTEVDDDTSSTCNARVRKVGFAKGQSQEDIHPQMEAPSATITLATLQATAPTIRESFMAADPSQPEFELGIAQARSLSIPMSDKENANDANQEALCKRKLLEVESEIVLGSQPSIFGDGSPPLKKPKKSVSFALPDAPSNEIKTMGESLRGSSPRNFSSFQFQFQGEHPDFYSSTAGNTLRRQEQAVKGLLTPAETSPGVGSSNHSYPDESDDEIEFGTPARKVRRAGSSRHWYFRKRSIGLKVGDVYQQVPIEDASSSTSTNSRKSSSPASTSTFPERNGSNSRSSIGNLNKDTSSSSKAERARLDSNGFKSLLVKFHIKQGLHNLGDIEKQSDAFRKEMQCLGATMGPKGWVVNVRTKDW